MRKKKFSYEFAFYVLHVILLRCELWYLNSFFTTLHLYDSTYARTLFRRVMEFAQRVIFSLRIHVHAVSTVFTWDDSTYTRVTLSRWGLRIKEFRREKKLASLYRFITLRSDTFARRNIFAILCTDTTLPDRIKMCINFLRFFFFYFLLVNVILLRFVIDF